jgi:hypothetical protein
MASAHQPPAITIYSLLITATVFLPWLLFSEDRFGEFPLGNAWSVPDDNFDRVLNDGHSV